MEDGDMEKYRVSSLKKRFCIFESEQGLYQMYFIAGIK